MTDFSLQKLAKICKSASAKELALLAIGYDADMLATDKNFDDEMETIFSTPLLPVRPEFYFYWRVYKKLNILMQRVNINLAYLYIYQERLSKYHLLTLLKPLYDLPEGPENVDLTSIINACVDQIHSKIHMLSDYRFIVKTIEQKYFNNQPFISHHPIWNSIDEVISELAKSHNDEFVQKRKLFTQETNHIIEVTMSANDGWCVEEISKIVETAQQESGYRLI